MKLVQVIIDIELMRGKLRKVYHNFFVEGFEPMSFGEAFPMLLLHVMEKVIFGYSSSEGRMLQYFSSPELSVSDTDAFLELSQSTVTDFLEARISDRLIDYYQWEVSGDQRSISLFKNICVRS